MPGLLPNHWLKSIRARLLISLVSVVGFTSIIIGALTYRSALREAETLFDYQLQQMALSLRDQGAISPDEMRALNDNRFDFVVQIWTFDGRLIYASKPGAGLPARAVLGLTTIQTGDINWRVYSTISDNRFGDRIIQVAQPLRIRARLAAAAALRSMLPLLALAPVLAIAIWWTIGLTLRPLDRIATEMRLRKPTSLNPIQMAQLPEEIAPLVQALNGLLSQLKQAFDNQRDFVANAAHELRSPLTALKLQVQVLERSHDPSMHQAAIGELKRGIDRATHLIEQLLTLARHEGSTILANQLVDLRETVRLATSEVVRAAAAKNIELELQADEPVFMAGQADAIRILVRNLVDNAVRYTPISGHVQIQVYTQLGLACLVIDDSGPGIPPMERDQVFERFYRGKQQAVEGSGLGLAIVRHIAQLHQAKIDLATSPLNGLRVLVYWPLPPGLPASAKT